MEQEKLLKLEQGIYGAVAACRERIFDLCEVELSQNERWALLRKQLLKHFGGRGLEGDIERLFKLQSFSENNGGNCA